MKTYYYATSVSNEMNILTKGLHAGFKGITYMTEDKMDAIKFADVTCRPYIVILKIEIPDNYKNRIIETFDHNYDFFKCRCWGYKGYIPVEWIKEDSYYTNPIFGQ